jgi:hypothetical protein
LRKLIRATLGLAFLATFTLASTANAATILGYSQTLPTTETVTERIVGTTTVLTTGGTTASPIQILIGNLGGQSVSIGAFVNFTLTSALTASPGATSLGGFSGVITISPSNTLTPTILIATISNGTLTLGPNGTASLLADTVFTGYPPGGAIATQVGGPPAIGGTTLGFSNVTGSLAGFTANNVGTFSTAIPEPMSLVPGSIAILSGVGVFGYRRLRPSKA